MTSGDVTVTLDSKALDHVLYSEQGPVGLWLLRQGLRVEAEAKRLTTNVLVNVITGRLSGSITTVLASDSRGLVVRVGTNVEYALPVHEGQRPHDIYPKGQVARSLLGVYGVNPGPRAGNVIVRGRRRAAGGDTRVLRFKVEGGRIVYAHHVHHPGTHPRPFLRQALNVLR